MVHKTEEKLFIVAHEMDPTQGSLYRSSKSSRDENCCTSRERSFLNVLLLDLWWLRDSRLNPE